MLDNKLTSCLPCGLHTPSRNYYFDGKLMVARDFIDEQDYERGLRYLHNQMLHGTGTVCGLRVIQHPMEDCRRDNVVIEPGMALDCCGQELIVPERLLVPLTEMLAEHPDLVEQLTGEADLVIGLRRCDHGAEPLPVLLPGCGSGETTDFGRVEEGVEVVLWAEDPRDAEDQALPQVARFDWVHTMTFGAQTPKVLHVNEVEQRLQVAVDNAAGGSHGYVFISDTDEQAQTHDLTALLEGPAEINDTGSSRETGLVFFAGHRWEVGGNTLTGIGVWRAGEVTTQAEPLAVIPTESRFQRLAVSPVSGALFVLEHQGTSGRLVSYGAEALATWIGGGPAPGDAPQAQAELEFDHGFGNESAPFRRGARMIKCSHDGKFLAVCSSVGRADERLYIIDIATFNAGAMTLDDARVEGLEMDGSDRLMALDWSLDGRYLYLLRQRPASGGEVGLFRYVLTGDDNNLERAGRGAVLEGSALDLAVAPTESRAYVLLTDPEGASRMTTVDIDVVVDQGSTDPTAVELSSDALDIHATARSMVLMGNGRRLYLAAADSDDTGADRGLVAVINITEADCGAKFLDPIDGCPTCTDDDHRVPLAALPLYTAANSPPLKDPDQAGEGEVGIDNFSRRTMVPSAATLRDVIECMLAQGVAEGPPGPRGNPGEPGRDGASIVDVTVSLEEPGAAPSATTEETDEGLVLNLSLPSAADGVDGVGIDDATIEYVEGLAAPQVAIVDQGGQRILDIDLPAPPTAPAPVEVNPIVAMSWAHGQPYPVDDVLGALLEIGIAVAFEEEAEWIQIVPGGGRGPTMVAELQRRWPQEPGIEAWSTITLLDAVPMDYDPGAIVDGVLTDWELKPDDADVSRGFVLRGREGNDGDLLREFPFEHGEVLRLVFFAEFVIDVRGRVVGGSHVGGKLPTHEAIPGDTFYSWFTVPDRG